jgi:DNA uptake protein ComE-like DNA-binding protein
MNARPIKTSLELPVNVADVNDKVTLYTNINTASRDELKSLGFSDSVVDAIIQYVDIQPFGTKDEIRKFMTAQNAGTLYSKIGDFIVVR